MILSEKWFWIVVLSVTLIFVMPLLVVWTILHLDPTLKIVATIFLVVLWGVVSGYKDWIVSKRAGEEK